MPSSNELILIESRGALLEVLATLGIHRKSVVLVGAQAIYLHTPNFISPVAAFTKDADLALKVEGLVDQPSIEFLLNEAGFTLTESRNPGQWLTTNGIPVDLMVPATLAGEHRRSADLPGHGNRTARSTSGIEGCLIDCELKWIASLEVSDVRTFEILVAGPASLLVAKVFKISDRLQDSRRMEDKDAHDVYRLLSGVPLESLLHGFSVLFGNPTSEGVARIGCGYLQTLFADGADAPGSFRAARAEGPFGTSETVAQSVFALSKDLLEELFKRGLIN